ncbi:flavin-containing monooxygenase [Marinobacter sp. LN3S78]|uniref:flavin-containing monooxygenase n=1 Tax=Marinobacter sp. LN3S78 TaxID=3382300 RepID=UPI00387B781A
MTKKVSKVPESRIERKRKVAVVGMGPSGIATLKNLRDRGIECVGYESHSEIGGIWNRENPKSSAYRNTHTITSKEVTAFKDLPLNRDLPVYPRHDQILDYLQQYVERYGLRKFIRFNHSVEKTEKLNNGWKVHTSVGTSDTYTDLVIANGHNWHPRYPDLNGKFDGKVIHARDYEDAKCMSDKRVLVIGGGNSACDIAVECSQLAEKTDMSMRRRYNFYPKFILGKPTDQVGAYVRSLGLPVYVSSRLMKLLIRFSLGRQEDLGLPKSDHLPLETPAIINSLVPYYIAHGRVGLRPAIKKVDGRRVYFEDGTSDEFDVIVAATGYEVYIPFVEPKYLSWGKYSPDFYLFAFSPRYNDLFISGMTDSTGGHFPTVDLQSQVIAAYIKAKEENPLNADRFDNLKQSQEIDLHGGVDFIDVPRNATQFILGLFKQELHNHLELLEPAEQKRQWKPFFNFKEIFNTRFAWKK